MTLPGQSARGVVRDLGFIYRVLQSLQKGCLGCIKGGVLIPSNWFWGPFEGILEFLESSLRVPVGLTESLQLIWSYRNLEPSQT